MATLKEALLAHCFAFVEKRIDTAKTALADAQDASNDDTKSSAGDKYETGREMMQQEIVRNTRLLADATAQGQVLQLLKQEILKTVLERSTSTNEKLTMQVSPKATPKQARSQKVTPAAGSRELSVQGSVVYTNQGNFFIAVSAGILRYEANDFYTLSSSSPMGRLLLGKRVGDTFSFNGKIYSIEKIV